MKTTDVTLISFTYSELKYLLKDYQKDLLADAAADYLKGKTGRKLNESVAELILTCSKGFRSTEFSNFIEISGVPFLDANDHKELIDLVYFCPDIFIPFALLDKLDEGDAEHPEVIIMVDGKYLDMKRLIDNR